MRKFLAWGAVAITIYGVVQMPRLGLDLARSSSKLFGVSRRIDFNDSRTIDDAQREVRKGPLRVMGRAAKIVYKGSQIAMPSDALTVGFEGGQVLVGQLEEVGQRRRNALTALKKAEQEKQPNRIAKEGDRPGDPRTPSSSESSDSKSNDSRQVLDWSTSIAGTWSGSIAVSERADGSDEVVAPAGFEALHQSGNLFDCKVWIKNDPEARVEKFQLRHVGGGRYVGKMTRKYTEPSMDFVETVNAVVDLQRKGSLIRGEIMMKTNRRFGDSSRNYDSVMKLELAK